MTSIVASLNGRGHADWVALRPSQSIKGPGTAESRFLPPLTSLLSLLSVAALSSSDNPGCQPSRPATLYT